MMVNDGHPVLRKRRQYGDVQFDEGTIFPQGAVGTSVESHLLCNHREQVIAVDIAQVTCPNLGTHIPPIERSSKEGNATNLQTHIGDHWQGMPLEAQSGEPGIIRMTEWHFQHQVMRQFKQLRGVVGKLDDEGKEIKRSACSSLPAQATDHLGEFY